MVDDRRRRPSSKGEKVRDSRTAKKFLEELSWLLSSYSNLDFRTIRDTSGSDQGTLLAQRTGFHDYVSKNPNIHFLAGVLPVIFSDEHLFPSNEDIVEFSEVALGLPIVRWDKRSRYELIGIVVCETLKLDNNRLERLVRALSKILANDPLAKNITQTRKARKLSWNEVIQKLTADE